MICRKKWRLWFVIPTSFIPSWAPTDFVRPTTHRRGAVRLAAAGETWWCQRGGINGKLTDCFEANMQVDGVPLLKNYGIYQASLPERERGISQPLKLYKLQFYVRQQDWPQTSRPTVAYIAAASRSGESSVLVGFLHSSELSPGNVAQQNFTHYLYMPFANNGRNYHDKVSQAKPRECLWQEHQTAERLGCGLHEGMLQGTSLLSCLRKVLADSRAYLECTFMPA